MKVQKTREAIAESAARAKRKEKATATSTAMVETPAYADTAAHSRKPSASPKMLAATSLSSTSPSRSKSNDAGRKRVRSAVEEAAKMPSASASATSRRGRII